MPPESFALKPGHKVVKAYFAALEAGAQMAIDHELGLRHAFEALLEAGARSRGWYEAKGPEPNLERWEEVAELRGRVPELARSLLAKAGCLRAAEALWVSADHLGPIHKWHCRTWEPRCRIQRHQRDLA